MAAKKEIRVITASGDLASVVDRGADVETLVENLTYESKGLKTKISEAASGHKWDSELSVRLRGNTATAIATSVEKVELDVSASTYPDFKAALDKGFLTDVVDKKLKLVIPPDQISAAMAILSQSGLKVSMVEELTTTAKKVREMNEQTASNPEVAAAVTALNGCLKKASNWRIDYERN